MMSHRDEASALARASLVLGILTGMALLIALMSPAASPAESHRIVAVRSLSGREQGATTRGSILQRSRRQRHYKRYVTKAIIGGATVPDGGSPWLAFIANSVGPDLYQCTGTVVSPNVILTAGHCAENTSTGAVYPPGGYAVVTGSLDWTDSSIRQVSAVSHVIVDPAFNPATGQFDAALLVLSNPTTAPAIPLATPSDIGMIEPGTLSEIDGWGITNASDSASAPNALQYATTVIQSPYYCGRHVLPFDPGIQLCAIDAPTFSSGACFGDSGGPLLANDLVGQDGAPTEVGITSRGEGNCSTTAPDTFTRVDAISPWAGAVIAAAAPSLPSSPTATPTPPSTTAPTLPRMSQTQANSYVRQVLQRAFGRRFQRPVQFTNTCTRTSATRFTCSINWSHGPNDYFGTVTVWYQLDHSQPVWNDRYSIHWVRDACYFRSGDPKRCRVWSTRGTA